MKNAVIFFVGICCCTVVHFADAQVAINAYGTPPDATAMLDVSSTSKGFLAPRMNQSQRLGISSPATGLIVYQNDENVGYYYYTGASWVRLADHVPVWSDQGSYLQPLGPIGSNLLIADSYSYETGFYSNMNTMSNQGKGAWFNHTNASGGGHGLKVSEVYTGTGNTGTTYGAEIYSSSTYNNQYGLYVTAYHSTTTGFLTGIKNVVNMNASSSESVYGIFSESTRSDNTAENIGIYSIAEDGSTTTGVIGRAMDGDDNRGVYGWATTGDEAVGVDGFATGGTTSYGVRGVGETWGGFFGNNSVVAYVYLGGNPYPIKIVDGNQGDGKVLTSDASGNGTWVDLPAYPNPGGANGDVQFNNGGNFGGDPNLFWDNTNKRLGIGTTTPATDLEVDGDIKISTISNALMIGDNDVVHVPGFTDNISVGVNAGTAISSGRHNAFFGDLSGNSDNTAWDNTFIGHGAGRYTTLGGSNTFVGSNAGIYNTEGTFNTYLGYQAGYANETSGYTPTRNTFVGGVSGYDISSGNDNTFVGYESGTNNSSGAENTYLGKAAGHNASTSSGNVFIGYNAGYSELNSDRLYIDNSSTSNPLIYGEFDNDFLKFNGRLGIRISPQPTAGLQVYGDNLYAGYFTDDYSDDNVHIVHAVYEGIYSNDAIAVYGKSTPVSNSNYGIGGSFEGNFYGVHAYSDAGSSQGYSYGLIAECDGSDGFRYAVAGYVYGGSGRYGVYGDATATTDSYGLFCNGNGVYTGTWNHVSDRQLKKNITEYKSALEIVMQLEPKMYEFRKDEYDFINLAAGIHYGFVAQDLEKVLPELVGSASLPMSRDKNPQMFKFKTTNTDELIPILTRAIQEQQEMIEEQQQQIQQLQDEVSNLLRDRN